MGIPIYHIHQSQKGGITEKMNTIRKIKRSTKALSPVVASIILIAVTVAVSIAVAAWMGALTVGFMGTEEAKVTSITWNSNSAVLTVRNTGTTNITITEAYVNGGSDLLTTDVLVPANSATPITVPMIVVSGYNYNFQLRSAKGTTFPYTASAP